ncbi:MAG: DNA repair protein RecO [Anaerolineae bacterium]|nr:DNA repair protein RecO [Anaerolineae bacterium]
MSQRRERLYRTEAVVLRRQAVGEADRLLTLYTPTRGKVRVIAKGVRKPTSRKAGHLELFAHSTLLVARGKTLDIVTQAESLHSFRALREDLERVTYAHYAVELLDRFSSEEQENQLLFNLLVDTLVRLCETEDLMLTSRFYELRLLALEGYQPQLFYCLGCSDEIRPVVNYLDPDRGGVLCPRCGTSQLSSPGGGRQVRPLSVSALKVLRYLQTHDYETCCRLRIKVNTHRDVESVMLHYITYVLERSLKSVEFLRHLRREE